NSATWRSSRWIDQRSTRKKVGRTPIHGARPTDCLQIDCLLGPLLGGALPRLVLFVLHPDGEQDKDVEDYPGREPQPEVAPGVPRPQSAKPADPQERKSGEKVAPHGATRRIGVRNTLLQGLDSLLELPDPVVLGSDILRDGHPGNRREEDP